MKIIFVNCDYPDGFVCQLLAVSTSCTFTTWIFDEVCIIGIFDIVHLSVNIAIQWYLDDDIIAYQPSARRN